MVSFLRSLPDAWKRSILNSEETLNHIDEHNLTSANITAKTARKMRMLEKHRPSNVEIKLVETAPSTCGTTEVLHSSHVAWEEQ